MRIKTDGRPAPGMQQVFPQCPTRASTCISDVLGVGPAGFYEMQSHALTAHRPDMEGNKNAPDGWEEPSIFLEADAPITAVNAPGACL